MNNTAATPTLIVLCGVPGSGKSTWAAQQEGYTVHSSDAVRKFLYGSEECQQNPLMVFAHLDRMVLQDLRAGRNCVYDSTAINRRERASIFRAVETVDCRKVCVFFDVPAETAKERNRNRVRVVPEWVIDKMYQRLQIPSLEEGFDEIIVIRE